MRSSASDEIIFARNADACVGRPDAARSFPTKAKPESVVANGSRLTSQFQRFSPPKPSHEHALGSFVKNAEQEFSRFNTASLLRGIQTDSGGNTAVS